VDGRGQGDGEMIYQRIKTYETGLFCFVSPKQVRGWYKPQSGSATRSVRGRGLTSRTVGVSPQVCRFCRTDQCAINEGLSHGM